MYGETTPTSPHYSLRLSLKRINKCQPSQAQEQSVSQSTSQPELVLDWLAELPLKLKQNFLQPPAKSVVKRVVRHCQGYRRERRATFVSSSLASFFGHLAQPGLPLEPLKTGWADRQAKEYLFKGQKGEGSCSLTPGLTGLPVFPKITTICMKMTTNITITKALARPEETKKKNND